MSKRKRNETQRDDGTYVAKKRGKFNIFAFIVCVLIAVIIWLYASNLENKEKEKEEAKPNSDVQVAMVIADPRGL